MMTFSLPGMSFGLARDMTRPKRNSLASKSLDGIEATHNRLNAPHPDSFVRFPQCWVFACRSRSLRVGGIVGVDTQGRRIAVYRGADGGVRAVDARCPHLGSDLSAGRVAGLSIECPYHHFRFGGDGTCARSRLRTQVYHVVERFGAVFVFVGGDPTFPFPDFPEVDQLTSAEPLHWTLNTPWYMVGANAFDARHFRAAHGRRLLGTPKVEAVGSSAMRVTYHYEIEGDGWVDRGIRWVSGSRVVFEVTSWCGNVLLVRAKFARDISLGVVVVEPGVEATDVTVIVNAEQAPGGAGRVLSTLRARLKRFAIRRMLLDDFRSLERLRYVHDGLLPGDETIAGYLRWVVDASRRPLVASEEIVSEL